MVDHQQVLDLIEKFCCPVCSNKFDIPSGDREPTVPCIECKATICRACVLGDGATLGDGEPITCPLCPHHPPCRKKDLTIDKWTLARYRMRVKNTSRRTRAQEATNVAISDEQQHYDIADDESFALSEISGGDLGGGKETKTAAKFEDIYRDLKKKAKAAKRKKQYTAPSRRSIRLATQASASSTQNSTTPRSEDGPVSDRQRKKKRECEYDQVDGNICPGSLWELGTKIRKYDVLLKAWHDGELVDYQKKEGKYVVKFHSRICGKISTEQVDQDEMIKIVAQARDKKPP